MKPNRKLKKPDTCSKLILEEIIGLTVKNLIFLGFQIQSGHQPSILVWDASTLASVCELKGHQYGVACMAFSTDGKHIASVGFPHNGYLCLWDYKSGNLVTKLKASSSFSAVSSVTFSYDANFIITGGKKHLKCWIVGCSTRSSSKTGAGAIGMHGRPVNLGHHKGCSFISLTSSIRANSNLVDCNKVCASVPIYALTDSGVLCLLNGGVTITNSVDLKVNVAYPIILTKNSRRILRKAI